MSKPTHDEIVAFRTWAEDYVRKEGHPDTKLINGNIIKWLAEWGILLANRAIEADHIEVGRDKDVTQ